MSGLLLPEERRWKIFTSSLTHTSLFKTKKTANITFYIILLSVVFTVNADADDYIVVCINHAAKD